MKNLYATKFEKYKEQYISLYGGNADAEMDMIINRAKDVNILGMGETTHGVRKIDIFRVDLFKKLVEYGYTTIVLEESYDLCERINNYIKGKGLQKLEDIFEMMMWPWKTRELYGLVEWMKGYNEDHGNVLEFKGVDINFSTKKTNKANKGDDRDGIMFKNFQTIYKPGHKYFLWAHNEHLERKNKKVAYDTNLEPFYEPDHYFHTKRFGNYLAGKYGDKYYVVAASFFSGSFCGVNHYDASGKIVISTIKNIPNVVNLKSGLYTELKGLLIMDAGAGSYPKDPLSVINLVPAEGRYDAVLIINNEAPRNFLELDSLKGLLGKILYYGSKKRMKDGAFTIATNRTWLALLYMVGIDNFIIGFEDDKPYIQEKKAGDFKKLMGGKSGYIYHLPIEEFHKDDKLRFPDYEYIANGPVKPIRVRKVDNILKWLKQIGIKMVTYQ